MDPAEVKTLEYYQLKLSDLTEKYERYKAKSDLLQKENNVLAEVQSNFYNDKQDIVEFLNIKVGEHEKMISNLEQKLKDSDKEKIEAIASLNAEKEQASKAAQDEYDNLSLLYGKAKRDLDELVGFSEQKTQIEEEQRQLKALLDQKENEYRETIHNLERKILQDKSHLKREMLQKVNEAVANFRKVADLQMAKVLKNSYKTTKRAIRENMALSSQLKKMSSKTIELINENKGLVEKISSLKQTNSLLGNSEKELARINCGSQKVIKLLVQKLKESDQILELTYEETQDLQESQENIELNQQINELQNDYNFLVSRVFETTKVLSSLLTVIDETSEARYRFSDQVILDYLFTNVNTLTTHANNLLTVHDLDISSQPNSEGFYKEDEFKELSNVSSPDLLQDANPTEVDEITADINVEVNGIEDGRKTPVVPIGLSKRPSINNAHNSSTHARVDKDYLKLIGPIVHDISKPIHYANDTTSTGVQTEGKPFGEGILNTDVLLGEVRKWEKKSLYLPRNGPGMYHPRSKLPNINQPLPNHAPVSRNPKPVQSTANPLPPSLSTKQ